MKVFLLFQLVSNSYLCAVILITQFVTYPSFLQADTQKFISYHRKYVNIISFIVAPVMLIELITLSVLVYMTNDFLLIKSLILLICIWLTTFIMMVPTHNNLSLKFDEGEIKKLINYNWIRTFLWFLKLVVIFFILYEKF